MSGFREPFGNYFQLQIGASLIVIHELGAINKDNRFQLFDKIIEIDGKKISSETSENDLKKAFQHCYGKVIMCYALIDLI